MILRWTKVVCDLDNPVIQDSITIPSLIHKSDSKFNFCFFLINQHRHGSKVIKACFVSR